MQNNSTGVKQQDIQNRKLYQNVHKKPNLEYIIFTKITSNEEKKTNAIICKSNVNYIMYSTQAKK